MLLPNRLTLTARATRCFYGGNLYGLLVSTLRVEIPIDLESVAVANVSYGPASQHQQYGLPIAATSGHDIQYQEADHCDIHVEDTRTEKT